MFHDTFTLLFATVITAVGGFMFFFAVTMARTAIRLGPAPKGLGIKDATWRATGLTMSAFSAIAGLICFGVVLVLHFQGFN